MISEITDIPSCIPEFPGQGVYSYFPCDFGSKILEVKVLYFRQLYAIILIKAWSHPIFSWFLNSISTGSVKKVGGVVSFTLRREDISCWMVNII